MRNLLIICLLLVSTFAVAQKGTVIGTITDKEMNNEPLPFANVFVKGTKIGGTTDFDGKYSLSLPAGKHTIVFSFIGYKTAEVPVTVVAGKTVVANQLLGASEGITMDEVLVKAVVSHEKESVLLTEQKKAVVMQTQIGAQELSRKGVSDVAAAVTKAAGVTKQEGGSGSIFVRGLGDRYNVSTLNGLPLPSNNPSNKNISLDIFTTDIVESVGISKTFESQNYADFGGANIDIAAKRFSGKPFVSVGLGLGANSNVAGLDQFYVQDGPNYFGFGKTEIPNDPYSPSAYSTSWDRQDSNYLLNNSVSLSAGKRFNLGEVSSLSTFFTASFDADNKFNEGVNRGGVTKEGIAFSDFYKKAYKHNTNTTVMGTADYKINENHSVFFTTMFLNSTSQEYAEYEGENQDFNGGFSGNATIPAENDITGFVKRGTFDQTQLIINQLVGKNKLGEQWDVNWAVGYSILNNVIPDRMQNTFVPSRKLEDIGKNKYTFFTNSSIHNHRYFQNLTENEFSSNISVSYKFAKDKVDEYKGKATLGYSGKFKDINFDSKQYSFFPNFATTTFVKEDIHNVDGFLVEPNFDTSNGDKSSAITQLYNGYLNVNSVFASVQYAFSEKLSVILGARLEQLDQYVFYVSQEAPQGGRSKYAPLNFLPSLIAKYKLNEKQNLKLALSKTYTLPQFKEKVNMIFQEVAQDYNGNPNVYASTNYNADLGWEYYPNDGELISVTAFGKLIQDPINEMFVNSSSGNITYANTGEKAIAVGVEVELRKNIFEIENANYLKNKLSYGINASYLYHNQDLDNDKILRENGFGSNFTFEEAKLAGASDLLANADISYLKELAENKDISATLSYGYFSDKLAVIGNGERGNMVDKAVNKLDLVVKSNLSKNLKLGLSFKNILNPAYERVQGIATGTGNYDKDVLVSSYKLGSSISLSLGYKF